VVKTVAKSDISEEESIIPENESILDENETDEINFKEAYIIY
jgi:hypothetical protein